MYNAITAEMDYSLGHRSVCACRGAPPRDPYDRAKLFTDHMAASSNPMTRTAATLQLGDVHLLERFYNQMCLLVEAQKASDPLSLIVVQLVRAPLVIMRDRTTVRIPT